MLIVRLRGGLGNQLFGYAFARALSLRTGAEVKLDATTSFASDFYERSYALRPFDVRLPLATASEIRRLLPAGRALQVWGRVRGRLVIERGTAFQPELLSPDVSRDRYLMGFWQTERYFREFREQLCEELTVRSEPDGPNRALAREIGDSCSVAVHVRRLHGISVTGRRHEAGVLRHGGCSMQYYEAAMNHLLNSAGGDVRLFVFADDPDWCRENLPDVGGSRTFVEHNGFDKDYEDLRLMSLCRHHIIANSTFSWWGAWLGSAAGKTVIAPEPWMQDASVETPDLIPEGWIRLPAS